MCIRDSRGAVRNQTSAAAASPSALTSPPPVCLLRLTLLPLLLPTEPAGRTQSASSSGPGGSSEKRPSIGQLSVVSPRIK
eukprot:7602742-Pyramimonas_sp.AAC.1